MQVAGLVNYLAAEGQTATERAIELAQEILPAGESHMSIFYDVWIDEKSLIGPLAIRAAKMAIDRGSQLDLYVPASIPDSDHLY